MSKTLRASWDHLVKTMIRRFLIDRTAAVAPLMAMLLLPISGAIAIAVEQGEWYYFQRSMQNAADAAALAAAVNDSASTTGYTSGTAYQHEAASAAGKFGYVDGVNNVTLATTLTDCPANAASGSTCYQTSISTVVPIGLSALVGFRGNTAFGNGRGQIIPVTAIAAVGAGGHDYCIWSLSPNDDSFRSNGGPKPDLQGCSIMSNGNATCNGHDLGAFYGDAAGTNDGCGETRTSGVPAPPDPYAALASNIPADTCPSGYPQIPKKGSLPATNIIGGSLDWTGDKELCGDIQLSADTTLTGSNTTVIIRNGMLDLNGHTLKTASGAAATIVFAGTGGSYSHYPSGSGTLDIKAPTSGPWSGVAMYQDPALTSGVSFTYSGNSPTWDITGLVYLPKANVTFSGAVNKSSNGSSCFLLVAWTLLVNGTGNIFANNTDCANAGLPVPSSAGARAVLVQ